MLHYADLAIYCTATHDPFKTKCIFRGIRPSSQGFYSCLISFIIAGTLKYLKTTMTFKFVDKLSMFLKDKMMRTRKKWGPLFLKNMEPQISLL